MVCGYEGASRGRHPGPLRSDTGRCRGGQGPRRADGALKALAGVLGGPPADAFQERVEPPPVRVLHARPDPPHEAEQQHRRPQGTRGGGTSRKRSYRSYAKLKKQSS